MKTIEELQAEKRKIDFDIAHCKAAIREMTASVRERGRFAPVKQYNDIQIRVRRLGQESQRVQHEIASINRVRKDNNQNQLSACFVKAAKHSLPDAQFCDLLAMANLMLVATGEGK